MDSEKVDELLNRYWNCETSLEEEEQLQRYFLNSSIPDQHKDTAALFRYFHEQKKKSLTDPSFNGTILKRIRAPKAGHIRTLVFNSMRIAAGVIVLILAVWLVRLEIRKSSPQQTADTYDDPRIAFEETKKALLMISKSFGTAEEQAKKINLFNEAKQEIQQEEVEQEL